MKTALVTGGTGFIGHYLANELDKRGYKVTVIDKAYNNCIYLNKNVNFILNDIRTGGISGEYDYVYHLAAKRSVTESFHHPQDYMSTNIWGTYNIIQQFPRARVINISSSAALEPKSIYGISKKCAEHFANLHKNRINVRLMNIFGERQLDIDMAIPAFMHALKYNKQAVIYGDGTIQRDYTYVLDVVDELIRIGEGKRKGTTEIGYSSPITIMKLYEMLCKLSKKKSNFKFGPPRKGDMKKTCSKYKINEPKYGFTEGIRSTVRWYLKCKEF
jgi:nucleoside-diphosphate-sugar epimerase